MKVNEWINQKLWQSIFIRLAAPVADVVTVQVQDKRCLLQATPKRTAKRCPKMICGKAFNLYYICILYSLDIAIALKVVLKDSWLILKTSAIHSWAKTKLIVPIAKQKKWFDWEYNSVNQFSALYWESYRTLQL
ncbi:hypothetical protein [Nostoc sp. NMS8]|uniref:hypothetical protein n=1 Tax=Nostoc sp. NMS8 TaxID=2815392 RepID=UPI0025F75F80|nr:hypothetical protein [Nostoc sp. NMS8]MBN3960562.1 hypothetical protein [Nostoc sp. NMS8]